MSLMPFVIAVEPEDLEALDEVVDAGRAAEIAWLKEAREAEGVKHLRGAALSKARGRVRARFAAMRSQGKLAGTRDLVVARAVRADLKARSMDGPYQPVPSQDAGMPGRRVGTGPRHYNRISSEEKTTLTARMPVRLPADLGEQLVRATYWTSAPAVKALWEWHERWGDGPVVILREAERRGATTVLDVMLAGMASRPTADALLEKAKLQAQIITTGDIFRSALKRAIR